LKQAKVWLGESLGSVARRTYEKMVRWEYIDLGELHPKSVLERLPLDTEIQKLVVLPGFELAQAKQKPVSDIITWMRCLAKYTAGMSKEYPQCTPGFMAHMLAVLKAYVEVEDPAWRLYNEVYQEKMVATECRHWTGMDVQLYQEVCAGRLHKKLTGQLGEPLMPGPVNKRPREERRLPVCWQFNTGRCSYGTSCKFLHACEGCYGPHRRSQCRREVGGRPRQAGSGPTL